MRNAVRMTSGAPSGSSMRAPHFTTGANMPSTSTYWCERLWIRSRPACPVSATTGAPSSVASATPVRSFVAPGPSVARHTPG